MTDHNPNSTAKVAGHPLHPMIIPFPIAFLVSAFGTDLAYLSTGEPGWATASMWLLGAGISMALLAAVLGFTDFMGDRRVRRIRDAWLHMIGNLIAVALAAVNFYLRSTGGADAAIAPAGVVLSGAVVALLLFNGWKGWELVYKHHVGVSDADSPEQLQAATIPIDRRG
ncbi:conserved hypothetical membrane protein [Phenylobacterium zucineum HLK1]|uniref:Conserved hypothetical membrane protein n=1 Tax=Phenylobacterium zucineum (strain HLK1) TaxID=450851 RepID=B4RD92_PHEZH|nr:DUF2231 domain-containing protein [Phenylobacterium zucineum]ACG76696.1 conserved hypothetical membrane protein [Phenylobacterium zucineum HLK1]